MDKGTAVDSAASFIHPGAAPCRLCSLQFATRLGRPATLKRRRPVRRVSLYLLTPTHPTSLLVGDVHPRAYCPSSSTDAPVIQSRSVPIPPLRLHRSAGLHPRRYPHRGLSGAHLPRYTKHPLL